MARRQRCKPSQSRIAPQNAQGTASKRSKKRVMAMVMVVGVTLLLGAMLLVNGAPFSNWTQSASSMPTRTATAPKETESEAKMQSSSPTRYFAKGNLTLVWDTIKPDVMQRIQVTSQKSNIGPKDYAGPDRCKECHPTNYEDWSRHPHRWMNAMADEHTVVGDFSGDATIQYQGGVGRFFREGNRFLMSYERGELSRLYEISQTIGSRFYQYYIGKGLKGSEPSDHPYYRMDHVLPFGFWIDRQAWVPIVHVHDELPDSLRWESSLDSKPKEKGLSDGKSEVSRSRGIFDPDDDLPLTYARACNFCHTTFPLADMFVRMPDTIGASLTDRSIFAMSNYVAHAHPAIWDGKTRPETLPSEDLQAMTGQFIAFEAKDKAATLGISCEACHLGCSTHTDNKDSKPSFLPHGPDLYIFTDPKDRDAGRTAKNVNSTCSRCHAGTRPTYAGGMSTWNSTEYTDALKGKCYSQLTCIQCHDPHKPTGKQWSKSPEQDDLSCLKCHSHFKQPETRQQHTHHAPSSSGDRCMNCHMPHINEGMQDVVRTHTIFSPTQVDMIQKNQPNACNLCHLDKPIDWTLDQLKSWYGRTFDERQIGENYPQRDAAVGLGWLRRDHPATRLATASAFARQDAKWGIPAMVAMLDDEYLMNRQFAQLALEKLTEKKLNEDFGYWYFATKEERRVPISRIRKTFSNF